MKWKTLALTLYFQMHGRRCVLCSKLVDLREAHIDIRDKEYYLMHLACAEKEKTQNEESTCVRSDRARRELSV
jgi:hypothetical protein